MSRTAAELLTARIAAHTYREIACDLDRETAADPTLHNMPLTIRILRQYAAIVRRAARAEELDPHPDGLAE